MSVPWVSRREVRKGDSAHWPFIPGSSHRISELEDHPDGFLQSILIAPLIPCCNLHQPTSDLQVVLTSFQRNSACPLHQQENHTSNPSFFLKPPPLIPLVWDDPSHYPYQTISHSGLWQISFCCLELLYIFSLKVDSLGIHIFFPPAFFISQKI